MINRGLHVHDPGASAQVFKCSSCFPSLSRSVPVAIMALGR